MQVQRRSLIPGVILILLGIAFALREFLGIGPELVLILGGLVFLVPYFFTRWYGLLIPGMLLVGLGAGLAYERVSNVGWAVPLGLGIGFVLVYVVDWIVTRSTRWWPLIPAAALAIPAIISAFPDARVWLEKVWPVLLILLGLLLVARNFVPRRQPKTGGQ